MDLQDQGQIILLKRGFIKYCKSRALAYTKIETYKRQLCNLISSINYVIPFANMDLDKKCIISQKNLQTFLIQHKYYHGPQAINRYYGKYSHNKQAFNYDDVLEALLPHSDYLLMVKEIKNQRKYLYQRVQNQIIVNTAALVIDAEIAALTKDYFEMSNITNRSLRTGATLWRLLDRNYKNSISIQQIKKIGLELGIDITENQWKSFILWHFGTHSRNLSRQQFIKILNIHNTQKRQTFTCKYDQFVTKQQTIKKCESENQRQKKLQSSVKQKIRIVRSASVGSIGKVVKQEHFPYGKLMSKTLLSDKKGYKNPQNLIKYSIELKQIYE